MNKKAYVVGFLLDRDEKQVVLIRKKRPLWQQGLLNGVGGKIEPEENPLDAMRREFQEETGAHVETWTHYATMSGPDWTVFCYFAHNSEELTKVKTQGDSMDGDAEEVATYYTDLVFDRKDLIGNVRWLIPLALNSKGISLPIMVFYES